MNAIYFINQQFKQKAKSQLPTWTERNKIQEELQAYAIVFLGNKVLNMTIKY
jgi:hypothetical protein